jgi:maltose-binding protein MalE
MSDEQIEQPQVEVKTLKFHTHAGEEHQEGDVYSVPADQVNNLVAQGMVARTEPELPL